MRPSAVHIQGTGPPELLIRHQTCPRRGLTRRHSPGRSVVPELEKPFASEDTLAREVGRGHWTIAEAEGNSAWGRRQVLVAGSPRWWAGDRSDLGWPATWWKQLSRPRGRHAAGATLLCTGRPHAGSRVRLGDGLGKARTRRGCAAPGLPHPPPHLARGQGAKGTGPQPPASAPLWAYDTATRQGTSVTRAVFLDGF